MRTPVDHPTWKGTKKILSIYFHMEELKKSKNKKHNEKRNLELADLWYGKLI